MLLFYNISQKPTSWGKLCDCWSTFCEKYDCIQLRQFQVWNSNTKQKAEKKKFLKNVYSTLSLNLLNTLESILHASVEAYALPHD